MNGFWIVGIVINLTALAIVLAWAVRAWKQADAARRQADEPRQGIDPDS